MLSTHSSPALVSAAAAKKLPRYLLLILLFAFIAPRLLSDDVWAGRNMISFGVAWSMNGGSFSDLLFTNVDGSFIFNRGPLTAWLSALFIKIFGGVLNPVSAFHLTTIVWFSLLTASTWYATYYLARRDEAQPLALVFGGEAARKDYGRVIADVALLLLVGTYGTVEGIHEIAPATTLLALSGLLFLGVVIGLDNVKKGSIIAGIAIGLATMASSFGCGLWFLVTAFAAIFVTRDYASRRKRMALTFSVALGISLLWPLVAFIVDPKTAVVWFKAYLLNSFRDFEPASFSDYIWIFKNFAWALLPSWPFALWALYSWRSKITSGHIVVPLAILIISLCSVLFTGIDARSTAFCLLPSMVVLASFGIATAKKSTENILDYFSGIVFSLAMIVLWVYFVAWESGFPEKMAHSITRLAPQVAPTDSVPLLILGALCTFVWVLVVLWRLKRHPVFLWRGAFMGAVGLTLLCVSFQCLFGSLLNGARSMQPIISEMNKHIEELNLSGTVFSGKGLSTSQRAAFFSLGNIQFTNSKHPASSYAIRAVPEHSKNNAGPGEVLASVPGRPRSYLVYQLVKESEVPNSK